MVSKRTIRYRCKNLFFLPHPTHPYPGNITRFIFLCRIGSGHWQTSGEVLHSEEIRKSRDRWHPCGISPLWTGTICRQYFCWIYLPRLAKFQGAASDDRRLYAICSSESKYCFRSLCMHSPNPRFTLQRWLYYWVVYASFSMVEIFADYILFFIPFYFYAK